MIVGPKWREQEFDLDSPLEDGVLLPDGREALTDSQLYRNILRVLHRMSPEGKRQMRLRLLLGSPPATTRIQ